MTPLVLASSSPWRRELLERLGLPFSWASPDIDESPRPQEAPTTLVQRLSSAKAMALADIYSSHLIIGSDQVAVFGDKILGKPHTAERARAQLAQFSGERVRFVSIPARLVNVCARLLDRLGVSTPGARHLPISRVARLTLADNPYPSSRVRAELGWDPVYEHRDALLQTGRWAADHPRGPRAATTTGSIPI